MPVVPFEKLPDSSQVWVFGSDIPLHGDVAAEFLKGVDAHLADWKAHGAPLTVGSQWRFDRFLVVAVDQSATGASGCSVDGLFRVLQKLQRDTGANMVGGGRVFYRDGHGEVQCASRDDVQGLVASGAINRDSVIFDTTLTDLGALRSGFETRAKDSWVKEFLSEG